MKTTFIRSPYNYDMNKAGDESGLECKDQTLAQQHFKDECDINTIVDRFGLTGEIPVIEHLPQSQDFEGIFDYQTAMNAIVAAQRTFDSLPAKLRARFQNSPAEFVAFCDDTENLDEAIKLGLASKRPQPAANPTQEETNGQSRTRRTESSQEERQGTARAPTAPRQDDAAQGPRQGPAGENRRRDS